MTSLAFTDIKQLYDVIVMETAEMFYVPKNKYQLEKEVRRLICALLAHFSFEKKLAAVSWSRTGKFKSESKIKCFLQQVVQFIQAFRLSYFISLRGRRV